MEKTWCVKKIFGRLFAQIIHHVKRTNRNKICSFLLCKMLYTSIKNLIQKACSLQLKFLFYVPDVFFSWSLNCYLSRETRPPRHWRLHNFAVVPFSTTKYLWETKWVFSLQHRHCQSLISPFNSGLFRNSSTSQRLMKGHLVCRMKTWQQSEAERLALLSYQRDPQPERLKLDSGVEICLRSWDIRSKNKVVGFFFHSLYFLFKC